MSWANFMMDLATIPSSDIETKKDTDTQIVAPEDEEKELRELLARTSI
jgi:hypothetical protein